MDRKEFFKAIKDSFFEEKVTEFEAFKIMVKAALPVFGTLETNIEEHEDGKKTIQFIDRDEADIVVGENELDTYDLNTDMSTFVMQLTLDDKGIVETVEHGIQGLFTPANKDKVLLLASFIGKRIILK